MLKRLTELFQREISGNRIVDSIRHLHTIERWFTYPKFMESSRYVANRMKSDGISNSKIVKFKADGKSMFGAWRVPMAWDAKEATLTIIGPEKLSGQVIADYKTVPCSLVMWSGPTLKNGVTTEIIDVGKGNNPSDYKGKKVRGKIVLVSVRASGAKGMAARHGAVGVLTDWITHPDKLPDEIFWNNSFGDIPSQWGAGAGESGIFGFCISPNCGKELRQILAKGEKLIVNAKVDSRLYVGDMPVVTACIPGSPGKEEVLVLGHGYEQGACDNASGIASMMEALRVIAKLIKKKALPKPKRSIRMLVTNECFGTIGFCERYPSIVKRTVAGLCLDSPALDQQLKGPMQGIFRNPDSNSDFTDSFSSLVAQAVFGRDSITPWRMKTYSMTDNLVAHTSIGIPTVWMGKTGRDIIWHTTADTLDRIDDEQIRECAVYTAVYLYFLASAGEEEAIWLAGNTAIEGKAYLEKLALESKTGFDDKKSGVTFSDKLQYTAFLKKNAVKSTLRLVPSRKQKKLLNKINTLLNDIQETVDKGGVELKYSAEKKTKGKKRKDIIPYPVVTGPITYDPIPLNKRKGYADPRWGGPINAAIGWMDGKRTLEEVCELTMQETGRPLPKIADEIKFCIKNGLVGVRK